MSASIAADRARTNGDARLVALARESRGEALELMYSAYKSRIYTFLLRLLADPVGADDLTQDVFTKAYQAVDGFRGNDARAWLLAIVRNTSLNFVQRRRPKLEAEWSERLPEPADGAPGPEARLA